MGSWLLLGTYLADGRKAALKQTCPTLKLRDLVKQLNIKECGNSSLEHLQLDLEPARPVPLALNEGKIRQVAESPGVAEIAMALLAGKLSGSRADRVSTYTAL